MKLIRRQCSDKDAIQLRNKCNVDVKNLLSQCLNETEIVAFSKIEDIAQRLYDVICRIDKEKMKRETMDMLKNFFFSSENWTFIELKLCITNCRLLLDKRTRVLGWQRDYCWILLPASYSRGHSSQTGIAL